MSFFVVVLVLLGYLLSYLRPRKRQAPRSPHEEAECGPTVGGPEMHVGGSHV